MTESEWLACNDPASMAHFLEGKITERKRRLLVCACCRLLHWRELGDPSSRNAVEMAEHCADGLAAPEVLHFAREAAESALQSALAAGDRAGNPYRPPDLAYGRTRTAYAVAGAVMSFLDRREIDLCSKAAARSVDAAAWAIECTKANPSLPLEPYTLPVWRELFGNPFTPPPLPGAISAELTRLAKEQYEGKDRREQLRIGLRQSPYADWEGHFQSSFHPKGCWVLDAILGLV